MNDRKKDRSKEQPKRVIKKVTVRLLNQDELKQVGGGWLTSTRSVGTVASCFST